MTIKKHIPARKKSFCARHRCSQKNEPATAGYQSCKKWSCKVGSCKFIKKRKTTKKKATKKATKKTTKKATKTTKKATKTTKKKTTKKKTTKKTSKSSTGKVYVSRSGRKYTKCWSGYKRQGWKTKNGRKVPNCVKI